MAKLTEQEMQLVRRINARLQVTEQLKAAVQAVVACEDMGSNHIFEAFGSAGITLHPGNIQNILERRYARRQGISAAQEQLPTIDCGTF